MSRNRRPTTDDYYSSGTSTSKRRKMEKQKTKTETKEDLDDDLNMDALFGNDETEEEAQAKLETIQKLAAASNHSSTAAKEVWTGRNHRRLPVEIASPATRYR